MNDTRQINSKGAALSRLALDFDAAAVGFGQLLADGQPQTDALGFGGEERLEEFTHVLRRDAHAGILYRNGYHITLQAGRQG